MLNNQNQIVPVPQNQIVPIYNSPSSIGSQNKIASNANEASRTASQSQGQVQQQIKT